MGTNVLGDAVLAAIDAYISGLSSPLDLDRQALMRAHHNEIEDWIVEDHAHWQKVADPATGWLASRISWPTPDSFSSGLEVDFSSAVPAGSRAALCYIQFDVGVSAAAYRKSGDGNISNTPFASQEWSHIINNLNKMGKMCVLWMSNDYKCQFTVAADGTYLYIAYPIGFIE